MLLLLLLLGDLLRLLTRRLGRSVPGRSRRPARELLLPVRAAHRLTGPRALRRPNRARGNGTVVDGHRRGGSVLTVRLRRVLALRRHHWAVALCGAGARASSTGARAWTRERPAGWEAALLLLHVGVHAMV